MHLRESFDAGQEKFPLGELSFEAYAENAINHDLHECPDAEVDVYLSVACTLEVRGAAEALLRRHGASMRQALARLRLGEDKYDEAWAAALRVIFVGEGSGPAIKGYRGRGSLDAWLRVTTTRAAYRVLRRPAASFEPLEGDWASEVWRPAERKILVAECQQPFAAAMSAAMDALASDERRALRSHYHDRLSIDVLAEAWGVHRATAARKIARARGRLRERALAELETRLGLSKSSAVRLVREAQSQLELPEELLQDT